MPRPHCYSACGLRIKSLRKKRRLQSVEKLLGGSGPQPRRLPPAASDRRGGGGRPCGARLSLQERCARAIGTDRSCNLRKSIARHFFDKKKPPQAEAKPLISGPCTLPWLEAILAIHRFVGRRPERNGRFPSTLCAYSGEHLPFRVAVPTTIAASLLILPCSSAIRAPLWFIRESLFFVKGLFAFTE